MAGVTPVNTHSSTTPNRIVTLHAVERIRTLTYTERKETQQSSTKVGKEKDWRGKDGTRRAAYHQFTCEGHLTVARASHKAHWYSEY